MSAHNESHACVALAQDWAQGCHTCGAVPTVPLTGLCGPCTWGEAETMDGNWGAHAPGRADNCEHCRATGTHSEE